MAPKSMDFCQTIRSRKSRMGMMGSGNRSPDIAPPRPDLTILPLRPVSSHSLFPVPYLPPMLPLVGIAIVVLGFAFRVNPLLVVASAAIGTGLGAGHSLPDV